MVNTLVGLKLVLNLAATVAVLPAWLVYQLQALLLGAGRVFPGGSQAWSLVPGLSGVYLRRAFYQRVLARCSANCCISFGSVFSHATAEIGRRVYVGIGCMLGDVELGDDVLVGSHVSIINGGRQHGTDRLDVPIREQPGAYPRVRIGAGSWIGDRALVLADVGAHCVIGAGAVVTRPVPDYAIALGNPARVVRFRHDEGRPGMELSGAGDQDLGRTPLVEGDEQEGSDPLETASDGDRASGATVGMRA
jgi:acetyltransferase-like isoleucine patch superfamily enzyme